MFSLVIVAKFAPQGDKICTGT